MKKTISLVISALMLMSATACANVSNDNNVSAESETTATEQTGALNSADYVLNASYTPIYKDVDFVDELPGSGEPQSYEDLCGFLECYDDLNFVGYEIIGQYTPEEAVQITGKDFFEHSTTLYKAHIYYDYLNDKSLDLTVYLAKAGTPERQFENDPPYIIGQKLASYIIDIDSDWCIAVSELVYGVYDVNNIEFAYHISSDKIIVQDNAFSNLDMSMDNMERSIITSTSNNPVKFTQKSTLTDLAQFLRRDWTMKGYKFFDFNKLELNEDKAVD